MKCDQDFYFEWVRHEDQNFTNRCGLFLVAESLLFVGAPCAPGASNSPMYAGLAIVVIWLYVSVFHIYGTHRHLKNKWSEVDPRVAGAKGWPFKLFGSHTMMGIVLPMVLGVAWITAACSTD